MNRSNGLKLAGLALGLLAWFAPDLAKAEEGPWRWSNPRPHGNSIRAMVKYLDGISDQDIVGLNIPNGQPLVYELDDQLRPIRHYYLHEQATPVSPA